MNNNVRRGTAFMWLGLAIVNFSASLGINHGTASWLTPEIANLSFYPCMFIAGILWDKRQP